MGTNEDARVGAVLADRYKILEPLSSGGMGTVYRGERLELGRPVAIKFLHGLFSTHEGFRARFEREARAMGRLDHPYCVSVIDFGVADVPYIVMDFVAGHTLRARLDEAHLPAEQALRIACQILSGLAHAHGRGIIHRDIKPENIMLSEATGLGERVRIFDFGLAKLLDSGADMDFATTAMILGTPSYMSPEQTLFESVDHRSDLYSVGAVLFEMLTGVKPFVADDAISVIHMQRTQPPPTLKEVDPQVPWSAELQNVVAKALNKSKRDRFQTAEEFATALTAVPEAPAEAGLLLQPPLSRPSPQGEQPTVAIDSQPAQCLRRTKLGRRTRFALAGAAAIVVLVGGVLLLALSDANHDGDSVTSTGIQTGQPNPTEAKRGTARPGLQSPQVDAQQLSEVRDMIAAGRSEEAIKTIQQLRVIDPTNAELPFLLGNIFFIKKWWADGVDRYGQALRLDASYGRNPRLVRDLIDALASDKLRFKIRGLVTNEIGEAGLPFLLEAAKSHSNLKVRRRAAAIARELGG